MQQVHCIFDFIRACFGMCERGESKDYNSRRRRLIRILNSSDLTIILLGFWFLCSLRGKLIDFLSLFATAITKGEAQSTWNNGKSVYLNDEDAVVSVQQHSNCLRNVEVICFEYLSIFKYCARLKVICRYATDNNSSRKYTGLNNLSSTKKKYEHQKYNTNEITIEQM